MAEELAPLRISTEEIGEKFRDYLLKLKDYYEKPGPKLTESEQSTLTWVNDFLDRTGGKNDESDAENKRLNNIQAFSEFIKEKNYRKMIKDEKIEITMPDEPEEESKIDLAKEAGRYTLQATSAPKRGIRGLLTIASEIVKKSPSLVAEAVNTGNIPGALYAEIVDSMEKAELATQADYDPKGFADNIVSLASDLLDPRLMAFSPLKGAPLVKAAAEGAFLGGVKDTGDVSAAGAVLGGAAAPATILATRIPFPGKEKIGEFAKALWERIPSLRDAMRKGIPNRTGIPDEVFDARNLDEVKQIISDFAKKDVATQMGEWEGYKLTTDTINGIRQKALKARALIKDDVTSGAMIDRLKRAIPELKASQEAIVRLLEQAGAGAKQIEKFVGERTGAERLKEVRDILSKWKTTPDDELTALLSEELKLIKSATRGLSGEDYVVLERMVEEFNNLQKEITKITENMVDKTLTVKMLVDYLENIVRTGEPKATTGLLDLVKRSLGFSTIGSLVGFATSAMDSIKALVKGDTKGALEKFDPMKTLKAAGIGAATGLAFGPASMARATLTRSPLAQRVISYATTPTDALTKASRAAAVGFGSLGEALQEAMRKKKSKVTPEATTLAEALNPKAPARKKANFTVER